MSKLMKNSKDFTHLPSKKSKGFTIIEAAIAIAVLMIGLWSVMQLFPFGIKVIGDSQSTTVASNLVVAKIEEISAQDYDSISAGTIEVKARISSDPEDYLYDYQREVIVDLIDSNFDTTVTDVGLKKVTVTVYWTSPVGLIEKSTDSITVMVDL